MGVSVWPRGAPGSGGGLGDDDDACNACAFFYSHSFFLFHRGTAHTTREHTTMAHEEGPPAPGLLRQPSLAAPAAETMDINPAVSLAYVGERFSPNYQWVNVDPHTGRRVDASVPLLSGRQSSVAAAAAAAAPAGGDSPKSVAQSPPLEPVKKQGLPPAALSAVAKPSADVCQGHKCVVKPDQVSMSQFPVSGVALMIVSLVALASSAVDPRNPEFYQVFVNRGDRHRNKRDCKTAAPDDPVHAFMNHYEGLYLNNTPPHTVHRVPFGAEDKFLYIPADCTLNNTAMRLSRENYGRYILMHTLNLGSVPYSIFKTKDEAQLFWDSAEKDAKGNKLVNVEAIRTFVKGLDGKFIDAFVTNLENLTQMVEEKDLSLYEISAMGGRERGQSVYGALRAEAWQEAKVPESLIRAARFTGFSEPFGRGNVTATYAMPVDDAENFQKYYDETTAQQRQECNWFGAHSWWDLKDGKGNKTCSVPNLDSKKMKEQKSHHEMKGGAFMPLSEAMQKMDPKSRSVAQIILAKMFDWSKFFFKSGAKRSAAPLKGAGAKRARVAVPKTVPKTEPKTACVFDDNEKNLARAKEHYAKNHPGHKVVLLHVPTAGPKTDEEGNVVTDGNGRTQYLTCAEAMAAESAGEKTPVTGLASQAEKFNKIVPQLDKTADVYMDVDCCFLEDSTDQNKEYSHDELLDSLKTQGIDKHRSSFFKILRERKIMIIKQVLDSGAFLTFWTANNKASVIRRLRDIWELPEDLVKRCGLICGTQIMMNGEVEITPKHELLGGEVKTIKDLGVWDDIAL